jgi:hypothetical protein
MSKKKIDDVSFTLEKDFGKNICDSVLWCGGRCLAGNLIDLTFCPQTLMVP